MKGVFGSLFSVKHERLREEIRGFVTEYITANIDDWEEKGSFPREIIREMGKRGYLGLRYPKEVGGYGGDYFMNIILAEEMIRCGAGGFPMAVAVQTDMANPPILQFGSPYLVREYFTKAIQGEKLGAIGITEPDHGSDVASIKTRGVRKNGKWVINGGKTFITNGPSADYIVLVTRTNPQPGFKGISLIVVDMDLPGISVSKKLDKLGMRSSDTALLSFEDVEVPEENLLGAEGKGFYEIMWELQSERLIGAAGALGAADYLLEKWEETAGQNLPASGRLNKAREEIGELKAYVSTAKLFNYRLVRQFMDGKYDAQLVSITKYHSAKLCNQVAERLLVLAGSLGVEKNNVFERLWRDTRLYRIGAGTDEIMREVISKSLDLA